MKICYRYYYMRSGNFTFLLLFHYIVFYLYVLHLGDTISMNITYFLTKINMIKEYYSKEIIIFMHTCLYVRIL